jgi:hypothetical protein
MTSTIDPAQPRISPAAAALRSLSLRANHFFTGQLEPMQSALASWLISILTGSLKEQLR